MNRDGYTSQREIDELREELKKMSEKKHEHVKAKKALKIISSALFCIVVLFLVFTFIWIMIAKSRGETPNLFGLYIFEVQSGSMNPTLPKGCLFVAKRVADNKNLRAGLKTDEAPGDIVTYTMLDGRVVTHRIVGKAFDAENNLIGYRTQGDNPINDIDEEVLTFDRIIAVYCFKLPLT